MKTLKFNEGGQPVFLDDLKMLQDNGLEPWSRLVSALAGSGNAFLLKKPEVDIVEASEDEGTTTFVLKAGTLVAGGTVADWEDTRLTIGDWETPIYLVVRREESGARVFQDGQTRNCMVRTTVIPTLDSSGADEYYSLYDMKTISELLKDFVGLSENTWKDVPVTFMNGYGGKVMCQDNVMYRRIYIDIESKNATMTDGQIALFNTTEQYMRFFRSPAWVAVKGDKKLKTFGVHGYEGIVSVSKSSDDGEQESPSGVPVKIVFELPK